jgi:hypothetical protein
MNSRDHLNCLMEALCEDIAQVPIDELHTYLADDFTDPRFLASESRAILSKAVRVAFANERCDDLMQLPPTSAALEAVGLNRQNQRKLANESRQTLARIDGRTAVRGYPAHRSSATASIRRSFWPFIAVATVANAVLLIATITIYYQRSPIIGKEQASAPSTAKEQASEPALTTLTFHGWAVKDDTTTLPSNGEEVKPIPGTDWTLEVSSSGRIRGTVNGKDDDGQPLTWEVTGLVRGNEIAIARGSGSQNKNSATAAIRVTKEPDSETYLGYIIGKRCKTEKNPTEILVCPYMLTKDPQADFLGWSKKFSKSVCKSIEMEPPEMLCG